MTKHPVFFRSIMAILAMLMSGQLALAQPSVGGTVSFDGSPLPGVELML